MPLGIQDLVALAVVFAAAGYLARLAVGAVRGKSGVRSCSACEGCETAAVNGRGPQEPLISIGPIPPRS